MAIDPQNTDAVAITQLDDLILALETFLVGSNANGKMGKFTAQQLAEFIAPYISNLGASPFVSNTGSPLPNPISKPTAITFVGAGTFDQTTGSDIVTTAELNVLFWSSNGTTGTWAIGVAIDIDLDLYAKKTDLPYIKPQYEDLPFFALPVALDYTNSAISATSEIITGVYGLSGPYPVVPGTILDLKTTSGAYSDIVGMYREDMTPFGTRLGTGSTSSNRQYTIPEGVFNVVFYNKNISTGTKFNINVKMTFPQGGLVVNGELVDIFGFEDAAEIVNNNDMVVAAELEQIYTDYTGQTPTQINKSIGTDSVIGVGTLGLSDYIPTNGAKKLFGRSSTGAVVSTIFGIYDADKNPAGTRLSGTSSLLATPFELDIPDGVAFVVTYLHNETSNIHFPLQLGFSNEQRILKIKLPGGLIEQSISGNSFLPVPSNNRVNFQVPVNCNIADITGTGQATQDEEEIFDDWGIIQFPSNYDPTGNPVRLLIACHGTGTWIDGSSTFATIDADTTGFWLSQGFAVMDMNGIPSGFVGGDNTRRHFGAPFALQSYIKGYEYVTKNYNLYKNGCFVYGVSMGGLSSNMLVQSGSIPVIAQAGFAPCTDLFKQAYCNPWFTDTTQRQNIATYFGFTGTVPTWTTNKPPTQPEIDYFLSNIDKVLGYNPMLKQVPMVGVNVTTGIYKTIPSNTISDQPTEALDYAQFSKLHTVPVKIWHNLDDTTVKYRYSKYFIEMANRAGMLAVLRTFATGGHNAWLNGDIVSDIPTINGGTYSIASSQYECLLWFMRFLVI